MMPTESRPTQILIRTLLGRIGELETRLAACQSREPSAGGAASGCTTTLPNSPPSSASQTTDSAPTPKEPQQAASHVQHQVDLVKLKNGIARLFRINVPNIGMYDCFRSANKWMEQFWNEGCFEVVKVRVSDEVSNEVSNGARLLDLDRLKRMLAIDLACPIPMGRRFDELASDMVDNWVKKGILENESNDKNVSVAEMVRRYVWKYLHEGGRKAHADIDRDLEQAIINDFMYWIQEEVRKGTLENES